MNASLLPLGYGLIGAGRFGRFCLDSYRGMNGVAPRAVADLEPETAQAAAEALGVEAEPDVESLLNRRDVELVHIATPPQTHHHLVTRALEADKHVLCEKPLATRLEEAEAMIGLARDRQRMLAVNLIMRYNPLCQAVRQIVDQRLLGLPLHGFFENYARDEPLPPEHWFWDPAKSGGIFIEHGVHFFDLFRWWLGPGFVRAAQQALRPRTELIERVNGTVSYNGDVLVNFYHGFTQAGRMDRQELRLHFERGTIQLYEWVPTAMEIDALADEPTRQRLEALLPRARTEVREAYRGDDRWVISRHHRCAVDGRYHITSSAGLPKDELYQHVVRALLSDQLAGTENPMHSRLITEADGYDSLVTAVEADALARESWIAAPR